MDDTTVDAVADVLARLTRDQKIALAGGADVWHTASFDDPPVRAIRMSDGPAGVRGTSWSGPTSASFPCGSALGATFDPELVGEIGAALGRECLARDVDVLLAPTINLQRTSIGGRNFECFSEDPLLTSELAVAYIEGVQRLGVAACVKHLVGNDTEYERKQLSVEIDEATLRELYLVPFEAAVRRAGVRCVMAAYNRLNGTFCSEHEWLLGGVLRGEWGFDGVVVSDWFGCHSGAASLRAGLDLEMPGPPAHRGAELAAEIDAGEATDDHLDGAVERILRLAAWTRAGGSAAAHDQPGEEATRQLVRRAAVTATVLLKNDVLSDDRTSLPLAAATRIALIGPNARDGKPQGGGSAQVAVARRRGPYEALLERGFDVTFEPGGFFGATLPPVEANGGLRVELFDDAGNSATVAGEQLKFLWEQPPSDSFDGLSFGARATATFVPDASGTWELGALSIGPSTLRLDGDVVLEIPSGRSGGVYFGLASPEARTTVELQAGRPYRLDVEYPQAPAQIFRGFAVGARYVAPGDPIDRAVAAAAAADAAVVIVGTDEHHETEGHDRTTLALPGDQDALVSSVAAANPNTIVVLNAGSPMLMPWLDSVAAVLQLWFPGQELGDALADVLTGAEEPGGRLPITFPRSLDETPAAPYYPGTDGEHFPSMVYGERTLIGHRWYDRTGVEPLFPFGHGLGYTTFTIEPVAVAGDVPGAMTVVVDVANVGERPGSEVVQVYVEPVGTDTTRPIRTLAGFRRVRLDAGGRTRVDIDLSRRSFEAWVDGGWRPAAGEFRVLVGRSSRSLAVAGTVSNIATTGEPAGD